MTSFSFRDPSGFVFRRDGKLYRQVNQSYQEDYEKLMSSGLYAELIAKGLMISHKEVADADVSGNHDSYKLLLPDLIDFVSYPYEWSFSQLKAAALLTLEVQVMALKYGMVLKDASAFNVQYRGAKPIFIDTLSFESNSHTVWLAYKQFCQHFLAPLALMSYTDVRLHQLTKVYLDGIPVGLASKLLPWKTFLLPSLLMHIHLHARSIRRYEGRPEMVMKKDFSSRSMLALTDSLRGATESLGWTSAATEWGQYYDNTNYSNEAFLHKKEIVTASLDKVRPKTVWDLGANRGVFSILASDKGIPTIAFDLDPLAVEKNFLEASSRDDKYLLPLLLDLTNPSAAIGWQHEERQSFMQRAPCEMVLALGLVHHLAIANNTPLHMIANLFSQLCKSLLIEFIPKDDSQVQRLLASRPDIFSDYTRSAFESAFSEHFEILERQAIHDSKRVIYLMRKL